RAGDLNERCECRRIGDRNIGEVLAVDFDTRGLEALDQPVVGDVVGARSRVDPRNPQLAELALTRTAVAESAAQRMQLLLFGFAVEPGSLAAIALRGLQDAAPLLVGVDRPLYACHGGSYSRSYVNGQVPARRSAVQQRVDPFGVVG